MSKRGLPDYLSQPPDSAGQAMPPARTAPQVLDLLQLGWDNFERLCVRLLAADGDVEHVQLFGTRGQNQKGIDAYARPRSGEGYTSLQAKRVKRAQAKLVRDAVERFLVDDWAPRSRTFVLAMAVAATSDTVAEEIERQALRLRGRDVVLVIWDQERLSTRLKGDPDTVIDFFGLPTAELFCPDLRLGVSQQPRLSGEVVLQALADLGDDDRPLGDVSLRELRGVFTSRPAATQSLRSGVVLEDDVRKLLTELREQEPPAAERIGELLDSGGPSAVIRMLREHEHPRSEDTLALLVAAARIAAHEGAFADARDGYLRAALIPELSDRDHARQLVRAAVMADAAGEHARCLSLLDDARSFCAEHPAIAIAEARASRDSDYVLGRLADVEAEDDHERALLHVTRGQAHLAAERDEQAARELSSAVAADPQHVAVREFEAAVRLLVAHRAAAAGVTPEPGPLLKAAERFQELREGLDGQARWNESARLAVRAAESYALAEQPIQARAALDSIQRRALLDTDTLADVARGALVCGQPDFIEALLDGDQDDPRLRLFSAEAAMMRETPEERAPAAATLAALLDNDDEDIQEGAAFALAAAATSFKEIAWNPRAEEILRARHPVVLAMMRGEHLILHGDSGGAIDVIRPHLADRRVRKMARDHAANRGDWATAKDLSRAIVHDAPTARDRLADAEILRRAGDLPEAVSRFTHLASDPSVAELMREMAHNALVEIELDRRDFGAAHRYAQAWAGHYPDSTDAPWNLMNVLVRRHRYQDAYTLLREHDAPPENLGRAHLAAVIWNRAAPVEQAIRAIDTLSRQFDRQFEPLEGLLIATARDAMQDGVELPDEVREFAAQALDRFPAHFPESQNLTTVSAPTTTDELRDFVERVHGQSARAQRAALLNITSGASPVNALAAAAPSGDTTRAWLNLKALPLGFSVPELDAQDRADATTALGGAAVVDASALAVLSLLRETGEQLLHTLPGSLIANTAWDDINEAHSDLTHAGAPRTTLGHDPEHDQPVVGRVSTEALAQERKHVAIVHRLAAGLDARPGTGPDSAPSLAELVQDEHGNLPWRALVESLLLAGHEQRAIYSDDRWIRRTARSSGLPAFGTLALLDALTDARTITEDQRRDARRTLATRGGWGMNLSSDELADELEAPRPTPLLLAAFNDRAAWRAQHSRTADTVIDVLAAKFERDPDSLPTWLPAAVQGARDALYELHPGLVSQILIMIALGVHKPAEETRSVTFVQALVRQVRQLPLYHRTLGYDPVLAAVGSILELVADRDPAIQFDFFKRCVRRLPPLDCFHAVQLFMP